MGKSYYKRRAKLMVALGQAEKELRDHENGENGRLWCAIEELESALLNEYVRKDQVDDMPDCEHPCLEMELIAFMGDYDEHQWIKLADKYDVFAKAVDDAGDFYPVRLNTADLLDEMLSHQTGEFVREGCREKYPPTSSFNEPDLIEKGLL